MAMTTNVQDLIQNISKTVSEREIEKTKSICQQVKKMHDEDSSSVKVKLVMAAHNLEAEMF